MQTIHSITLLHEKFFFFIQTEPGIEAYSFVVLTVRPEVLRESDRAVL